jgi:hypothetical protein
MPRGPVESAETSRHTSVAVGRARANTRSLSCPSRPPRGIVCASLRVSARRPPLAPPPPRRAATR